MFGVYKVVEETIFIQIFCESQKSHQTEPISPKDIWRSAKLLCTSGFKNNSIEPA